MMGGWRDGRTSWTDEGWEVGGGRRMDFGVGPRPQQTATADHTVLFTQSTLHGSDTTAAVHCSGGHMVSWTAETFKRVIHFHPWFGIKLQAV